MDYRERIEEFEREGSKFLYLNLSEFQSNEEYVSFIEAAKRVIETYAPLSVYTITNMRNTMFDSSTKELLTQWVTFNKPFVIKGVVIGADGIKKLMFSQIFQLGKRKNLVYLKDKEHAIQWLLEQR